MTKPNTLSTTASALLTAAATRDDHLALPPERLPAAAQRAVVQSLLKFGLLLEVGADDDQPAWRSTDGGERLALRITEPGLLAIGAEGAETSPETAQGTAHEAETAIEAPQPPQPTQAAQSGPLTSQQADTRPALRVTAQAVLAAWDEDGRPALPDAMDALRAALEKAASTRPTRATSGAPRGIPHQHKASDHPRAPAPAGRRERPADYRGNRLGPHTVRGFLAGLSKKGITVTVLDRVRQVGPGEEGAKGSYTLHRIAEAG